MCILESLSVKKKKKERKSFFRGLLHWDSSVHGSLDREESWEFSDLHLIRWAFTFGLENGQKCQERLMGSHKHGTFRPEINVWSFGFNYFLPVTFTSLLHVCRKIFSNVFFLGLLICVVCIVCLWPRMQCTQHHIFSPVLSPSHENDRLQATWGCFEGNQRSLWGMGCFHSA